MGKGEIVIGLFALLFVSLVFIPHSSVLAVENNSSIILEHSEEWQTFNHTFVFSVFISDVDNDGIVEIVTGGCAFDHSQLRIWNWDGQTLALEHSEEWYTIGAQWVSSVFAEDIDGDGAVEILSTGTVWNGTAFNSQIRIWSWDGTTLTLEHSEEWYTSGSTWTHSVFAGDVDRDGVLEIVTGGWHYNETAVRQYAQLRIWNWDGATLTLEQSEEWYTIGYTYVRSIYLGDVDADGVSEIVTGGGLHNGTNRAGQLRVWNWDGTTLTLEHSEEWYTIGSTGVNGVFAEDVDDDEAVEILSAGCAHNGTALNGQLRVWNWSGTTLALERSEEWYAAADVYACSVLAGDVDADGVKEIVVAGGFVYNGTAFNGQLRTWRWNGSTLTLEHSEEWYTMGAAYVESVSLGDVDADGITETVTGGYAYVEGHYRNGQLRIWSFPDETPPVAEAGPDQTAVEDTIVTFDAGNSSDDVGIVSYEWDFGDGAYGTGLTINHTYIDAGNYTVTLTVKDAAGNSDTDSITVTVLRDTNGDGTPDVTDTDDDGDEMPDTWETENGLDPLDAADASLDPDGDGFINLQEYHWGTDPNNYFSPFPSWIAGVAVAAVVGAAIVVYYFVKVRKPKQ